MVPEPLNDDVFEHERGSWRVRAKMAAGVTAAAPALPWHFLKGLYPASFIFSGDFVGVARVLVSNDKHKPVASSNLYPQVGINVTEPCVIVVDFPAEWAKINVVSISSGTLNVDLLAVRVQM